MQTLLPIVGPLAAELVRRGDTVAIAESSTGGLISAALLSGGGASAYFVAGAVVYTRAARSSLLAISDADMAGLRPSTEPYALLLARRVRERHGATWGLAESGATGPTGNRYGDAAGHCCIALSGPREVSITVATGSIERLDNMRAFAAQALGLLAATVAASPSSGGGT